MEIPNCFYRISVKALVLNDEGKFLLLKEHNEFWELPGGGLDFNETPQECIERELKEEMGVGAKYIADKPSYFFTVLNRKGQWIANAVYETQIESLDFTPSHECMEIGFFSPEEATALQLLPNVQKFVEILQVR
jgi:8-oxo-dGTP diphosphatase